MLHQITKSLIRPGDLLKLTARVENNNRIQTEVANWFDLEIPFCGCCISALLLLGINTPLRLH